MPVYSKKLSRKDIQQPKAESVVTKKVTKLTTTQ